MRVQSAPVSRPRTLYAEPCVRMCVEVTATALPAANGRSFFLFWSRQLYDRLLLPPSHFMEVAKNDIGTWVHVTAVIAITPAEVGTGISHLHFDGCRDDGVVTWKELLWRVSPPAGHVEFLC